MIVVEYRNVSKGGKLHCEYDPKKRKAKDRLKAFHHDGSELHTHYDARREVYVVHCRNPKPASIT